MMGAARNEVSLMSILSGTRLVVFGLVPPRCFVALRKTGSETLKEPTLRPSLISCGMLDHHDSYDPM